MNLALIYGGKSSEHEVSLVSASSVARHIDYNKFKVVPIAITKEGKWYLQPESELNRIKNDPEASFKIIEDDSCLVSILPSQKKDAFTVQGKSLGIDAVFAVIHGTYCEDGTIQGLFEMAEVPYVGCGVMASAVTMDKEKTKAVWHDAGLPVVPYFCMNRAVLNDSRKYDEMFQKIVNDFGFPVFVKPCNAGSSVGAGKASNSKQLSMALMEAFMWDNKVLIEKSINAREIECSVTGNAEIESAENPCGTVKAYTPGEIVPTHEFYDYDAKYNDPDGAALKIPALLENDILEKIRTMACEAYRAVDASGLSRVDFFIDRDTNEIYLNEINTIPGFTSISMFPKMCEKAGLKYSKLIELLIEEAIERFNAKTSLQTSR